MGSITINFEAINSRVFPNNIDQLSSAAESPVFMM